MHTYLKDEVITKLLTDPKCRSYLKDILINILGIDRKEFDDNLTLLDIRIGSNRNIKNNISDVVYENKDGIYNIEINYNKSNSADIKNMTYICQLILRQNTKGNKYSKIKPITQINIHNYDYFNKEDFVYVSKLIEEKYHLIRSEMIKVIDINLEYLQGKEYKDLEKRLERLMYIFVCGDMKKVEEVCKGDEVMEKVSERLKIFEEEFDALLFYDKEEYVKACSYDQGVEQGIELEKIRITKNLLKKNVDEELISEITGLSMDNIEKIKIG